MDEQTNKQEQRTADAERRRFCRLNMTEEELEQQRRKERERAAKRRAALTEQERKEKNR